MVRIRLTRMGQKRRPFYRMVAADARAPRDGRFIEQLGYYDPMRDPKVVKLKLERIDHWLSVGAQPSDTATTLIAKARRMAEIGEEAYYAEASLKKTEAVEAKIKAKAKAAAEAAAAEAAAAEPEEAPAEGESAESESPTEGDSADDGAES